MLTGDHVMTNVLDHILNEGLDLPASTAAGLISQKRSALCKSQITHRWVGGHA